jgi:hypothetical protein
MARSGRRIDMLATTAALAAALLAAAPAGRPAEEPPSLRIPSLLGAESLDGGSAASAWAGFASLGVAYGQGITVQDDLGAAAEFDWSSTELWLSAFWRRPLGLVGGWTLAGRLRAGWWIDLGATYIHDDNRTDRGLLLAPALILSTRAGEGLVSAAADLPVTFTRGRGGGYLVAPKASVAYETPLYGALSIGVRAAVAWRGGGGDAAMRAGRAEPELLVLAGYRVF